MVTLQSCGEGYWMLTAQLLLGFAEGSSSLDACGKAALRLVGDPVLKRCRDKGSIVPSFAGWWRAAYV